MFDRKADVIEQASDLESTERDHAVARHQARVRRNYARDCVECGVHIPEKRQEILGGTDLCVDCAEIIK